MEQVFAAAFETWERQFREHPEEFMSAEDMAACEVLPLSESRARFFVAILNKLAGGRPWDQIAATGT